MPLNNGFYSDLNRFTVRGTTLEWAASGGATAFFFSLFGVPDDFALERLRLIEASNLSILPADSIDIRILSNPAAWREAEIAIPGSGEVYVIVGMDDVVSEVAPNVSWLYDDIFDPPLNIYDELKSNCIHFMLSSDAALSADPIFTIEVSGYKLPQLYETTHAIGQAAHTNKVLKVLRNDVLNDAWYSLGNTINPDYNKNAAITPFVLATDYVYFGMESIWNGLWFNINSVNSTGAITETWEYWDGSAWQTLTVRDNCTTKGATEYVFGHSGVIEWDTPSDWTAVEIDTAAMVATEPPYDYTSGSYDSKWIPRYWVRCNIDDITTTPTFYWIREKAMVI